MRVLFTLTATQGSLAPLRPVAGALRDAGHEVAFATAESCRSHVEGAGYELFAAGVDYHTSDPSYPQNLCGPAGLVFPKVSGLERLTWAEADGDRPAVLVSMGTIFHRTPEVYEAVLGGLGDEGVALWVALDDPAYRERARALQAEMRALPPVEEAVPLLEALVADRG